MLRIISNSTEYEFGTVTGITNVYSKSLATTPIPSMPVDRTFAIETAASLRLTVSFVRREPYPHNDAYPYASDGWSNAAWLERVFSLTNRWQARSNGYLAMIDGQEAGMLGVPDLEVGVYITNLSIDYKEGQPDALYGTIELIVTNQINKYTGVEVIPTLDTEFTGVPTTGIQGYSLESKQLLADEESYILISDSRVDNWYLIHAGKRITASGDYETDWNKSTDIVKSYEIHGGPSDPFEYMEMSISKKELIQQCPKLKDDIFNGCNQLIVSSVGQTVMTVSTVTSSSDEYNIIAYCNYEKIRGQAISDNRPGSVLQLIKGLLGDFAKISVNPGDGMFVTNCSFPSTSELPEFIIKKGTNVWAAIQICAMIMNAKAFFAGGRFYLIDYTKLATNYTGSEFAGGPKSGQVVPQYTGVYYGELNLHPETDSEPMYGRVVGEPDLGNEGLDTIINLIKTKYYADGGWEVIEYTKSRQQFSGTEYVLNLHDYIYTVNSANMKALVDRVVKFFFNYYAEPQISVSFTAKERATAGPGKFGWRYTFPYVSACLGVTVPSIDSSSTAYTIFSDTVGKYKRVLPQKLFMSSYTHNYPDFTTDYKFGVIENVDLSQSTSKILTRMNAQ